MASKLNKKIIIKWLFKEFSGVIFLGVILFASAGTLDWPMGWAIVSIVFLWVFANSIILIPGHIDLIAERVGLKKGSKRWDTLLMSIVLLFTTGKLIVAGLDFRYSWTVEIPIFFQMTGLIFVILGYALVTWAMGINAFFSQVVRVQTERGHKVITNGPYKMIRHPGYFGAVIIELLTPIVLNSLWALIPGVITAILFIIRTSLEDKTLKQELEGYQNYTTQTTYKLMPGIW